ITLTPDSIRTSESAEVIMSLLGSVGENWKLNDLDIEVKNIYIYIYIYILQNRTVDMLNYLKASYSIAWWLLFPLQANLIIQF
ncbi:MAG: hypothetical protein N7Q72_03125, partial [Spiroplasma sp. Tabriz.8]|nr:hypothetical protein [Spiroplasma sp. Tabriz.8]